MNLKAEEASHREHEYNHLSDTKEQAASICSKATQNSS